ncbi:MAG: type II toxin-antitoxin system VapC family toxin [Chloroflexi bacterium]|nr:type II toxin-antitoxin system VapC family toxin [Chloroflexota bacterium]
MATKVLDSYALMAFYENEPGADLVRNLLLRANGRELKLLMSVVNLGEIWCSIARKTSPETADHYIDQIHGMAIDIVDADWSLTRQAAAFKANGNIAYGDCFAAALAKNQEAELITGDKEFKALEGEIKISWLK